MSCIPQGRDGGLAEHVSPQTMASLPQFWINPHFQSTLSKLVTAENDEVEDAQEDRNAFDYERPTETQKLELDLRKFLDLSFAEQLYEARRLLIEMQKHWYSHALLTLLSAKDLLAFNAFSCDSLEHVLIPWATCAMVATCASPSRIDTFNIGTGDAVLSLALSALNVATQQPLLTSIEPLYSVRLPSARALVSSISSIPQFRCAHHFSVSNSSPPTIPLVTGKF